MGHGQAGCANCRLQCSAGAVQWVVQLRTRSAPQVLRAKTSNSENSNWFSRAKPTGLGMALETRLDGDASRRGGGESLVRRVCRAPRAPGQLKKRQIEWPPERHRQPRRRTGCTPEKALPTLFKRHAAPSTRRRACYEVFRLRRRGGRWVGEMGRALERALRRRPLPSRGAGRARAARSGYLMPTPSRILSHISRLTVAVLAANLVRWRARLAVGRV